MEIETRPADECEHGDCKSICVFCIIKRAQLSEIEKLALIQKLNAFEILLDGAFEIVLNMNDTFAYATSESETIDADHITKMIPIISEFKHHALTAYAAVKRGCELIHCKCCHDGEPYQAAKKKIMEIFPELHNSKNNNVLEELVESAKAVIDDHDLKDCGDKKCNMSDCRLVRVMENW